MAAKTSRRSRSAEELHRNKRMARTLGCLVASMTVGATLLDWIQPERAPALASPTELMSEVRHVLGDAGTAGSAGPHWSAVHVALQRPGDASTLTRSHFVIGREGQLQRVDGNEAREAIERDGVVRIGLLGSIQSNEITSAQWARASQLVQTLQDAYEIPGKRILVDDTLIVPMASPVPPAAPAEARPSSRSR